MVCDFCSNPNPVAMFTIPKGGITSTILIDNPGRPMQTVTHVDDGQWAACEECKADILAVAEFMKNPQAMTRVEAHERIVNVAMRSYDNFKLRSPDTADAIMAIGIADMHSLFWSRYLGSEPTEI